MADIVTIEVIYPDPVIVSVAITDAAMLAELAEEVTRATAAEASLAQDIGAETNRATAAEQANAAAIAAETNRATSAESDLGDDIAAEAARALAAEALLAPLASPGFTGSPTAPTAAPGTNSNVLATAAFVQAAIAALLDSSPAHLDTLNELAAALGDDANFAATVTAAISQKQDAIAFGSGVLAFLGTASSSNLAAALTDEISAGSSPKALFGDQAVSTGSSPTFASIILSGVTLAPDAANVLAQRNGTNAQTFQVFNTISGANYERGALSWASNVLRIGTEKAGTGVARDLVLMTDGTARLTVGATSGNLTIASGGSLLVTNGGVRVPSGNYVYWDGRSRLTSSTDGIINLYNSNTNGFTRLCWGPDTSPFPAIGSNGTTLEVVLGNGSAFTGLQSLYDRFGSGSPEGVVTAPVGSIYRRTNGGAGTSVYFKESGSGNTGWVAK